MKYFAPIAFGLLLFCVTNSAHAEQQYPQFFHSLPEDASATFYLVPPPNYTKTQTFPLVVSLHGAGEKGNRMVRYWKDHTEKFEMFLCCPNSTDFSWTQGDVLRILKICESVLKEYSINKRQVLLSGISSGGAITMLIGLSVPVMFPYLNPMSVPYNEHLMPLIEKAEKVPVYITHGAKDELCPPEKGGKLLAKILKEHGFEVIYVERPEDGHEVPEGQQERILNWYLMQCKKAEDSDQQ